MMSFGMYDTVRLRRNVEDVPAGTLGAVVETWPADSDDPEAYEVEFSEALGRFSLLTLTAEDLELVTPAKASKVAG